MAGLLVGAGGPHRPREPRPVGLVLDVGGQAQALRVGPTDPGQPGRVQDPRGLCQLQQRHDLELVLPDRLVGRHPGEPHRLQNAAERVQGHPGLLAHLPVGPRRAHPPPLVRGGLQEPKRQPAGPDRRRDPLHRQPGPLARRGDADLLHVGRPERARVVTGHQDAEVDHPLDLGRRGAGEIGKRRCRECLHARCHPRSDAVSTASVAPSRGRLASGASAADSCQQRSARAWRRSRGSSQVRRLPSGSALARRVPRRGGRNARPVSSGPSGPTRGQAGAPAAAGRPPGRPSSPASRRGGTSLRPGAFGPGGIPAG